MLLLMLISCNGDNAKETAEPQVQLNGEEIYQKYCGICHGQEGDCQCRCCWHMKYETLSKLLCSFYFIPKKAVATLSPNTTTGATSSTGDPLFVRPSLEANEVNAMMLVLLGGYAKT